MAEARHKKREPKHKPRGQAEKKSLWHTLQNSALFWLIVVTVFAVVAITGIVLLSRLLAGG